MNKKNTYPQPQTPLILRSHRLMDAFAKSDDERDFYLDRIEGFIIYVDLDKSEEQLEALEKELQEHGERYCSVPKMTFYEAKKIMEGFVHEKVYDIDIKEKLLDIIQAKQARENFLEFLSDNHAELEKWQQYYQERFRIRIIEWLRNNEFQFVFEEDLDLGSSLLEKLKRTLFDAKVPKDVQNARKIVAVKAKSYYSNEALNPRPKRGRPPKQTAKAEIEPQLTLDIYTTAPKAVTPFLFTPDLSMISGLTFSTKFEGELASSGYSSISQSEGLLASLHQKLDSLRFSSEQRLNFEEDEEDEELLDLDFEEEEEKPKKAAAPKKKPAKKKKPKPKKT